MVNKKPMTAPLNLNPADETTASLGLQHAGHIIRSILYTSDYRETNNRDKANKPFLQTFLPQQFTFPYVSYSLERNSDHPD